LPTASPVGLDPHATEILKGMSDYLGKLRAFSFTANSTIDIVADTGQKIQYLGQSDVLILRPNHAWLRRAGPVGDVELFYDGKTVTTWDKRANYYAVHAAPSTLDAMLDALQAQLDLSLPSADLLVSNVFANLMQDTQSGYYVGLGSVGGAKAHQLAFRSKDSDWQIWIEEGPRPVPLKYVITNKWYSGAPQADVVLRDWNVDPRVGAEQFAFRPPAGATKTEFLSPSGARAD
jgi:hypothetical protein